MNELIDRLRSSGVISRETVNLRSGEMSDFYIDIKKISGIPEILGMMADAVAERLDKKINCLAASGYGGLPLAAALSLKTGLPAVFVREIEKKHGKGGMIDGYLPGNGDIVAIIDDVFTTGSSLRKTIDTIYSTGAQIAECHVIVKRGEAELSVPVHHLITVEELEAY